MISVVASTTGTAAGGASATTAAIDTTGAVLIEVTAMNFISGVFVGVTDSKSNTWIPLLYRQGSFTRVQKWYAYCGALGQNKCGSGHTFTATGTGDLIVIMARAYAATGSLLFEAESAGGNVAPGTSVNSGSLTPSSDSALITTGLAWSAAISALSVSGGSLAIINQVNFSSGQNIGGATADEILTTAAARNAAWAWTTSVNAAACACCYVERTPTMMAVPSIPITRTVPIQVVATRLRESNIAQMPIGHYVQQLPMQRHVKIKKPDGTWTRVISVAGVRMKLVDGTWVVVGEF